MPVVLGAAGALTAPPAVASSKECGTRLVYGKPLAIRVVGTPVSCARVKRIIRGPCRDHRTWSCSSFTPPDPLLVWFRSRERFNLRWSTTIEAIRYPCAQATVTSEAWAKATRQRSSAFPTRRQVLADDLVRCRLLAGMTYDQVRSLLGTPDSSTGRRLEYTLGPERDSFFQVDSDNLSITFRAGLVQRARIYQD